MTDEQRRQYWRDMKEDMAEFRVAHRAESKGRNRKFVPARLITLPGMVLRDLEKVGWIESDGCFRYRPA